MLFHKTLNKSVISRALDRGIPSIQSKGLKDPLRTSPKRDLKFFGWSWRRGLIPPPLNAPLGDSRGASVYNSLYLIAITYLQKFVK